MGQSNMAGRDTRGLEAQVDDASILALNADGQWVVARDPIHAKTGRAEPGTGPGIAFAQAMREAHAGRKIALIPTAVGGSPLKRWERGADLYERALAQARAARSSGVLRGVLWHQGETDAAEIPRARSYATRLVQMFKDLRADLGDPDLPIVVGQLGEFVTGPKVPGAELVKQALAQMPQALPQVGFADSVGLEHKGDGLHFTAASSKELGRRYAQAMRTLQRSAMP